MKMVFCLHAVSTIIIMALAYHSGQAQNVPTLDVSVVSSRTKPLSVRVHAPKIVERQEDQRVWEEIKFITNSTLPVPRVEIHTNRYTELCPGICYQRPDGSWGDSKAEFVLRPDGTAEATEMPHKVRLKPNLHTPNAVEVILPEGRMMSSTFRGLYLFDARAQKRLVISPITNSIGVIVAPDRVVYSNCFARLKGDLVIKVTKGGLVQDVVMYESLNWIPLAEIGFDERSTTVEAWTEFYETPAPDVRTSELASSKLANGEVASDEIENQSLRFGTLSMRDGRAFSTGGGNASFRWARNEDGSGSVAVAKKWLQAPDGRQFLIESVRWREAQPHFERLEAAPDVKTNAAKIPEWKSAATKGRDLPPQLAPASQSDRMQFASRISADPPAFILDYELSGTYDAVDFVPGQTFLISGPVTILNEAILGGGVVVKMDDLDSDAKITINGVLRCETGPGRTAIFTTKNDHSVGAVIPSGTGLPEVNAYWNALIFGPSAAPADVHDVRIVYAFQGIDFQYGGPHKVRHSQLRDCWTGIIAQNNTVIVENVLFNRIEHLFEGANASVYATHVTAHQGTSLGSDWTGNTLTLKFTNSLLIEIPTCGQFVSCSVPLPSVWIQGEPETPVFDETRYFGSHYLVLNSPYRAAGTPNIDPDLRRALKEKTTHAPFELSSSITENTIVGPRVLRNDGLYPDLGYSYDVLDYVARGAYVEGDATLVATNGVVIGVDAGAAIWGIRLAPGARVISQGVPTRLNRFVEVRSVQEQQGSALSYFSTFIKDWSNTGVPALRLRFTELLGRGGLDWHVTESGGLSTMELKDCQMLGGGGGGSFASTPVSGYAVGLTNNVFEHSRFLINGSMPTSVEVRNNTFKGGELTLNGGTFSWTVRDNIFDTVTLAATPAVGNSHNGYFNTVQLAGSGPNVALFSPINFQQGPLGRWYLPPGSVPVLGAGSRSPAAAGLYHHTTQVNQEKAGCKGPPAGLLNVDLGFHYVAVVGRNLAVGKAATQSSTDAGGIAERAVNGNTDGAWSHGSVSKTASSSNPWWHVDLGASEEIDKIVIWNQTEPAGTLVNLFTMVSDVPFESTDLNATLNQAGVSWQQVTSPVDRSVTLLFHRAARYIRLQLSSVNSALCLAEVQIFGPQGPIDCDEDGIEDYMEDRDGSGTTTHPETRFDVADIDHDQDGMRTKWEIAYRLSPLDPGDKLLDADADGFLNYREHDLGYNPWLANLPRVSLTISDNSASELGQEPAVVTLAREGSLGTALDVAIVKGGTAQYIIDYEFFGNTVQIPAEVVSVPINIRPVNDTISEQTETVVLSIGSAPTGSPAYTIGTSEPVTVSILDNDTVKPTVTLTVTDGTAREVGQVPGRLKLARVDDDLTRPLSVTVSRVSGSASPNDYQLSPLALNLSIPIGETEMTITITPINDTLVEENETVTFRILAHASYTIGSPNQGTITIIDAPGVKIAATEPTCLESGSVPGRFTVTRIGDLEPGLIVNLNPPSGTAVEGSDYVTLPQSVSIPANETEAIIEVDPNPDALSEGDETVTLSIKAGTGYRIGTPGSATVVIQDKPTVTITSSGNDAKAFEVGTIAGRFTIERTAPLSAVLRVYLSAPSGTAIQGTDYVTLPGFVDIPQNQSTATVLVTPVSDGIDESDETVVVSIAANSAYLSSSDTVTITIVDKPTVTLTVKTGDEVANEIGPVAGRFTITRDGDLTVALSVSLGVPTGSATEVSDYPMLPRAISVPANQASTTVPVNPVQDGSNNEPDETVALSLQADAAYNIGTPSSGTVTIVDDQPAVTVTASGSDADAAESEFDDVKVGRFTINRGSVNINVPLRVNYSVTGSAQGGVDYQSLPGFVDFASGVGSATIDVVPLFDAGFEGRETVILTIAAGNYEIGTPDSAQVNLADDELPTLTVSSEGADNDARETGTALGAFTITRPNLAIQDPLTVRYALRGEAENGDDYQQMTGQIDIPGNATSVRVEIHPIDDAVAEGPESVTLMLLPELTYDVGVVDFGVVTIKDNDLPRVAVVASDSRGIEPRPGVAADPARFTIVREGDLRVPLAVYFSFSPGSGYALNETDFLGLAGTHITTPVTIPAGEDKVSITITPNADGVYEGMEQVLLNLQLNASYVLDESRWQSSVYITDVDLPKVKVDVVNDNNDPAFNYRTEGGGGSARFRFEREWVPGQTGPLTVLYRVSGTASPEDFQMLSGSVMIPAGQTTAFVHVQPGDDTVGETRETVVLTLTGGIDYTIGNPNSAVIEIDDNEALAFEIVPMRAAIFYNMEPHVDWRGEFLIRRVGSAISAVTGNWATDEFISGTGAGFSVNPGTLTSGTFTIPAGKSEISVRYRHATPDLRLKRFMITSQPVNEVFKCNGEWSRDAVLPCLPDTARVSFGAGNQVLYAYESSQPADFTINGPSGATIKLRMTGTAVPKRTDPAAPGDDFEITSTTGANVSFQGAVVTVSFLPGQTSAGLRVRAIPDGPRRTYVSFRFDTSDTLNMQPLAGSCSTPIWPYLGTTLQETFVAVIVGDNTAPPAPLEPAIDTDQDSLPDEFENDYFAYGFDPLVPNDAEGDPDRDGLNHWAELLSGTHPFAPDTVEQPDRENYVPVKLRVRDTGKVAVGNCAVCHRTRLEVGNISLFSPEHRRQSERIAWFRKGESYPIRLRDLLFNSPREIKTGTLQTTQKYTAEILPADAGPAQFIVQDPQQLLGANKDWSATLGTKQATLIVPRIDLTWEAAVGNVPLESNPAAQGGGLRIFPDDTSPTDTSGGRKNLILNVSTTPAVPNQPVLLKSFDVDDSTPLDRDVIWLIDQDYAGIRSGNDNRGTPKPGELQNTALTLDAAGRAFTVFTVSLKPGDNYRVGAVLNTPGAQGQAELDRLQVDHEFVGGWVEANDSPVFGSTVSVSHMLTVWRKLHLEFDSMGAPPSSGPDVNFVTGTIIRANPPVVGITKVKVLHDGVIFGGAVNGFEYGKIEIDGVGAFRILTSKSRGQEGDPQLTTTLEIDGVVLGGLTGRTVTLYDDDDRFLNLDSAWASNLRLPSPPLPADGRSADFVQAMQPSFEIAYIKPLDVNALGWNPPGQRIVPFKRNAGFGPTSSPFEGNLNLRGKDRPSFWAYSVVFGYQPEMFEDGDPDRIEVSLGANADDWLLTTLDSFCVIYLESVRDKVWGINSRDSSTTPSDFTSGQASALEFKYLDRLYGAIIHEVGHAPPQASLLTTDHSELGLMISGGSTPSSDTFTPRTILRFRTTLKWTP